MGVGRSSSLRTTADRSPLHDVRQPAPRDRGSTRYKFKFMDEHWVGCAHVGLPTEAAGAAKIGGARRDRTDDLLLAKQALSQLSYGPGRERVAIERVVGLGRLELPTSRLSSARSNQLSYKPVPGVSNQKSVIRTTWNLITDYRLPAPEQLVREEREMKTAASCRWAKRS